VCNKIPNSQKFPNPNACDEVAGTELNASKWSMFKELEKRSRVLHDLNKYFIPFCVHERNVFSLLQYAIHENTCSLFYFSKWKTKNQEPKHK
jgi:hypothetical protein